MKKTIYSTSLIVPVAYLIYCLINIEEWVKNHLGYGGCAVLPIVAAIIMTVIMLAIKIFKKVPNKVFYIPLVFVIVGCIIFYVGAGIPCCLGG